MTSKFKVLALSAMTAAFLVGCGGGSSSSAPTSTTLSATKGPILGATVTDSKGETAVNTPETNQYVFKAGYTPVPPYSVNPSSYSMYDQDGDLTTKDDRVPYTFYLKSNTTTVTPITTMLLDYSDEAQRQKVLDFLVTETGLTEEELTTGDVYTIEKPGATAALKILVELQNNYAYANPTNPVKFAFTEAGEIDEDSTFTSLKALIEDGITKYNTQLELGKSHKEIIAALEEESASAYSLTILTQEQVSEYENKIKEIATPSTSDTFSQESSLVYGKIIEAEDQWGTVTATFNTNGTYQESGTDDEGSWSCSGNWKAFDATTVGVTCDDNGTALIPDGTADQAENVITFTKTTLSVGDKISVEDPTETFELTVTSVSDTSSSTSTPAYAVQASDLVNKTITFDNGESFSFYKVVGGLELYGLLEGTDDVDGPYSEAFSWFVNSDGALELDGWNETYTFSSSPSVGDKVAASGDFGDETRTIESINTYTRY